MYLNVKSVFRPSPDLIIKRVSTDANGAQANYDSFEARINPDGRYVVFHSYASNLVAGDTNGRGDIFRKDLVTGAVTRVSTDANGAQADEDSFQAQISADGRYVVFGSRASNLVAGDTDNHYDIFRKDLVTGAVTRVSTDASGAQANGGSSKAHISADGRYVVFESRASNLVAGDTNGRDDIFRKDLVTGAVTRVSTDASGAQADGGSSEAQISADGRYVVFGSLASNLVAGDTDNHYDIFRKDLVTGAVTRISTDANGAQANGGSSKAHISADGRYVVFESRASNLVAGDTNGRDDIFRKDLVTGAVTRVSTDASGAQTNGNSRNPQISADGRYVVFESYASNLVAGDTNGDLDIFRKDLVTGAVTCISTDANGAQADSSSDEAQISSDGRYVMFWSFASNLVAGDTNDSYDIFSVDLLYKANAAAIAQGRYIETTLSVGSASQASIAWGDGTTSTVAPVNGEAAFSHTYASTGTKAATVILTEGALTWSVAHTIDLSAGTMVRNTALADTLSGGSSGDSLAGDGFANILLGNSGDDQLMAYAGNDLLDGGSGNDSLYGGTEHDSLAGSLGDDRLYGESGNDSLEGGFGNDLLNGSSGDDRLIGGTGKDTLTGGTGRDVFVFDDRETGSSKSRADYITDFSGRRGDRIDLKLVDADTKKRGDQKFSFIGDEKSFSKAGEVRYEKTKKYTYIYLNTDSDRAAEAVIKLKGSLELSKSWFVL